MCPHATARAEFIQVYQCSETSQSLSCCFSFDSDHADSTAGCAQVLHSLIHNSKQWFYVHGSKMHRFSTCTGAAELSHILHEAVSVLVSEDMLCFSVSMWPMEGDTQPPSLHISCIIDKRAEYSDGDILKRKPLQCPKVEPLVEDFICPWTKLRRCIRIVAHRNDKKQTVTIHTEIYLAYNSCCLHCC